MLVAQSHRGPDGDGEFISDDIHLGAVRLAIVDLKAGSQPVFGCGRQVAAVFNGEIFNQHAIRQKLTRAGHAIPSACDTDLIPHLFEEYGSAFVEAIRGMFSIALWNAAERKLVLVRDRIGIKPLFVAETDDYVIFASEIKGILASGLIEPEFDKRSIDDLFSLSYPCPPRTMFLGVREVLPAHVLEIDVPGRQTRMRKYWDCPFVPAGEHRRVGIREAGEELLSLLRLHVYDHLIADVPVGVYLSGGLDSSVIASVYRDVTGDAPTTFSVGFADPRFDESGTAAAVRRHIGSTGYVFEATEDCVADFERMIWHTELPLQFPLALPLMNLAGLARSRGFPVVLTGEGADELLGGYDGFRADKMRRSFDRPGLKRMRSTVYKQLYQWHDLPEGVVDKMLQNHEHASDIAAEFGGVYPPWFDMWTTVGLDRARLLGVDGRDVRSVFEAPDGFSSLVHPDAARLDPLDAGIALELRTRLPSWILLQGDRASMANGVEARVPFLDQELVEFMAGLPPSLKLHGFREKAVLRSASSRLLPFETVNARKRPFFTPIKDWFFGERGDSLFAQDLSRSGLLRTGLFDPDLVDDYRTMIRTAPPGHLVHHQLEWTLLLVLGCQILHRLFVQERRLSFGASWV